MQKSHIIIANAICLIGVGLLDYMYGMDRRVAQPLLVFTGMICLVLNLGAQNGSKPQQLITLLCSIAAVAILGQAMHYSYIRLETNSVWRLSLAVFVALLNIIYLFIQLLTIGSKKPKKAL